MPRCWPGAVKQLRAANPDTVFAAAGDLIGASTFESFIQQDKPTIDALNEAGLEVSAVGNHEFDQGYDDLIDRVMAPYDATTNPYGGANWQYIARQRPQERPTTPRWSRRPGPRRSDGVKVGFVGAVTEHLPELVSPAGIAGIHVDPTRRPRSTPRPTSSRPRGADVIVLLVHEGAPGTNCATMDDDPTSDFGADHHRRQRQHRRDRQSGHTHLAYDC